MELYSVDDVAEVKERTLANLARIHQKEIFRPPANGRGIPIHKLVPQRHPHILLYIRV